MTTSGSPQRIQPRGQPGAGALPRTPRPEPARVARPALEAMNADDEFILNLGDLPRLASSLQVDGFAPSLTSRLLDLVDRLRGR